MNSCPKNNIPKLALCTFVFIFSITMNGCMSYGVPKALEVHSVDNRCAYIYVDTVKPRKEWEVDYFKNLKKSFIDDLMKIPGVTIVENIEADGKSITRLTLDRTPFVINEPYLMVISLGIIPQPYTQYTGYKYHLNTTNNSVDIDALHITNDWQGWFASLVALFPRQTLSEEKANNAKEEYVVASILNSFIENDVYRTCNN